MNIREIRLACIQAAVSTPGNPNHVQQAQEYYDFVMKGDEAPVAEEVETPATTTTTTKKAARK